MGEVYRAHDTRLGRYVAIKVLPASFALDTERLRRFEQEARAISILNHPNILALYDVGTFEESPYLVTEMLEGQTLCEDLPLPSRKALDYARQIANGLAAAHAKGVTHRDLKPDNVFITKDGRAKILDFGLAKVEAVARDAEATRTVATTPGMVMGTVGYLSPEQARGNLADHRAGMPLHPYGSGSGSPAQLSLTVREFLPMATRSRSSAWREHGARWRSCIPAPPTGPCSPATAAAAKWITSAGRATEPRFISVAAMASTAFPRWAGTSA
jgi:serine/threonine protein kinase